MGAHVVTVAMVMSTDPAPILRLGSIQTLTVAETCRNNHREHSCGRTEETTKSSGMNVITYRRNNVVRCCYMWPRRLKNSLKKILRGSLCICFFLVPVVVFVYGIFSVGSTQACRTNIMISNRNNTAC